jgi:uncharacterized protein (UPF0264 family)
MEVVKEIAKKAKEKKLTVSVGGGITPSNSLKIAKDIEPDRINTRNLGFDLKKCKDIKRSIRKALEFECALLEHKANKLDAHHRSLLKRIEVLKKRLEN